MAAHERTLTITAEQREQLRQLRDHDPRPQVRERCAALLKVADGARPHWIARHGLLKPRDPDTVYTWLAWFETTGLAGVVGHFQGGYRGTPMTRHREEVAEQLHQPPPATASEPAPRSPIIAPCRYRLASLRACFPWLADYSLSGVWRLLQRLGVGWKHGYINYWSPDPLYLSKRRTIERCLKQAAATPNDVVAIFVDEMSYHRWPTPAADWWPDVAGYPRAEHGDCNNQHWRVIGGLNAYTGQVTFLQNYVIGRRQVVAFHKRLRAAYPARVKLWVIEDNWNVHAHPDVLAAWHTLPNFKVVWLPTYACWLNPIEKLWRWARQTILHRHRLSADWDALKQQVARFLEQFQHGSAELLHRVGLSGHGRFARILRP